MIAVFIGTFLDESYADNRPSIFFSTDSDCRGGCLCSRRVQTLSSRDRDRQLRGDVVLARAHSDSRDRSDIGAA